MPGYTQHTSLEYVLNDSNSILRDRFKPNSSIYNQFVR